MGALNSSRTRVQPVFAALHALDASGKSWLPALLRLGGRGAPPADVGKLESVSFEYPAAPPRASLRWLVANGSQLQRPRYRTSASVAEKRERLLAGDAETVSAALTAIEGGASYRRQWWCLEGTTMVDCALFTDRCVIFIEGKRTELGASAAISWYGSRNQVLRNLDCARAIAATDGRDYYTLLVVEEYGKTDPRHAAVKAVLDPVTVEKSLPHLSSDERTETLDHYLGFTTWQKILQTFHLDAALLQDAS